MKRKIGFFFIILLVMIFRIAAADLFYIDGARGNDSNDGLSVQTAWKTVGKANAVLRAGDTVYIRGGIYSESGPYNAVISPQNSGSPDGLITYQSYNGENVVITGAYHGVYLGLGRDYIKIDGIMIDGTSQETSPLAIFVRIFGSHNVIQNCKMFYLKIDSDWQKGIYIHEEGSYNKILYNEIKYVGWAQPPSSQDVGEAIWVEGRHNLIEGNKLDFCGHNTLVVSGDCNIFRRNELRGQWGRPLGLGGIDPQAHNVIEENLIWDAQGLDEGCFPNSGVQVGGYNHILRRNIIRDNDGDGIHIYSSKTYPTKRVRAYHNIIYNNGRKHDDSEWGYGVDLTEHDLGSLEDVVFKNNIFYRNFHDGVNYREQAEASEHTFLNNHWNKDGDPGFMDEANHLFSLELTSPCIDAGAFLTKARSSGSGTQLPVEDAGYFCDGFGIVEGDWIQLEGQSEKARIIRIDYANHILHLNTSLTWSLNQGISLAYSGLAPDIGAYEYVTDNPIRLSISASPTSGKVPLTVNFTGTATGGSPPYSFNWTFGDGQSSTAQNTTHIYSKVGIFTATLTATDSKPSTATASINITATAQNAFALSISAVTGAPAPGEGGTTIPSPGTYSFSSGSAVQMKSIPNPDYRLSKWTGDILEPDIFIPEPTIVIDKDKALSANFCTKCGDVTGDLKITPLDAQKAFDIFLGKISNPTDCEKENADVNSDGTKSNPKVTPADAQAIFNKYLNNGELPSDCSGNSRSAALAGHPLNRQNLFLSLDDGRTIHEGEILVPIIINSPSSIKAFGLDLAFPREAIEFIRLEQTEYSENLLQFEAKEIAPGVLRIGGFGPTASSNSSVAIIATLIFRVSREIMDNSPLTVIATYDDLQNVKIRNGMIYRKIVEKERDKSKAGSESR